MVKQKKSQPANRKIVQTEQPQKDICNKDIRKYFFKKEQIYNQDLHQSNYEETCNRNYSESKFDMSTNQVQSISKQKQLLITNSSLKLFIPVDKIKNFGIFHNKPQCPEKIFQILENNQMKITKKQIKQKNKSLGKKKKTRINQKKDLQNSLHSYIKKQDKNKDANKLAKQQSEIEY